MLADTVAVAHARAQPLGTASSRPVGLAGAHAVDAKAVVVAVRWALLLVAVLAAPPGLADAHTVVAAAVGAAADALPGGAVWATPPLVADADAIVARSRVAVAVVRAQADAAVHPAVTRVTDALSSAAEPVQVAVPDQSLRTNAAATGTAWKGERARADGVGAAKIAAGPSAPARASSPTVPATGFAFSMPTRSTEMGRPKQSPCPNASARPAGRDRPATSKPAASSARRRPTVTATMVYVTASKGSAGTSVPRPCA